jgi:hypothetical protein
MNKENNNHQKDLSQEEENKDSSSLSAKKDSSINLSPESNSINQKFFPSKENFFGVKTSPNKINEKIVSPRNHSPILNYFSGLSPTNKDNYPSPKEGLLNNNNSNKLSPLNFNYSPSTIFNAPNNKEITNFSLHNTGNYDEENNTLQEKMEQFLRKADTNNFFGANSIPSNSSNSQENKNEKNNDDEEEDDEGEGTLALTIDSAEEDYLLGKNKYKPYNEMNHYKKSTIFKNMNNHNNLNNNIVCNDNINNYNDSLDNNNILNNNNINNCFSHNYGNSIKVNNINENGKILQLLNIKENQIIFLINYHYI